MGDLFHSEKEARTHYGKVLQTKTPLYYERFDRNMLDRRPLVRELVARVFAKLFPEEVGDLLDVGCGTGHYFPLLERHARNLTGVDVCAPMVAEAEELICEKGLANCSVAQASALDLPFGDNTMDVVFSWDFLHHVPGVPRVVSEIARVLRPGGRYVALEPNLLNPSIAWYHLRRRSEWRLFRQNQFRVPRLLREEFDVGVNYDNTIISFLDEKTWRLWKAVDRLTSLSPFHWLSFRYILDCRKHCDRPSNDPGCGDAISTQSENE